MEINAEKIKSHIIAGLTSLNNERCLTAETTCIGTAKRGSIQIHLTITRDRDDFCVAAPEHRAVTKV